MLLHTAVNPAPNPRRVRIYLAEKGLSVPEKLLNILKGEQKSPEHLALYAPGQVPVLELEADDPGGPRVIGETVAICRYFEALHPEPPLFGRDAGEIAEIDMWIRRAEFTLMSPVAQVWIHCHPLTARVVKQRFTDWGEANRPRAVEAMRRFSDALEDCGYLAGRDFTMADIALLSIVDFAIFVGISMPDDAPALADWHARVSARPSASA